MSLELTTVPRDLYYTERTLVENQAAAIVEARKLLERIATALYSSDFTEQLGQYRNELFYREAKAFVEKTAPKD